MSSSKGVQPWSGKGVPPRKSSVMKLATPEMIDALKSPVPSGHLDVAPQSFHGIPPMKQAQKRDQAVKPLSMPGMGSLISMADNGPSLPAPPIMKKKSLQMIQATPDYRPIHREVPMDQLEEIKRVMEKRDDNSSIAADYIVAQEAIEGKNPYLTDTVIYTPQSRRTFHRFIEDKYRDVFHLDPQVKGQVDQNACAALEGKAGEEVEAFLYQKFIREYIPKCGTLSWHSCVSWSWIR
jgi:hypothetical protein